MATLDQVNTVSVEHRSMQNGVLIGGTLALLFSSNAVLVLFYGLIGVAGNPVITGSFLVASEIVILLLSFRRSVVLLPADYLFGIFLICIAVSFDSNGRTADARDWELLAVSLFAYPVCRLIPPGKIRTGFVWVSAAIVFLGSIVTAMALIAQWSQLHSKLSIFGRQGAAIYFLGALGLLLMALSTAHLTARRTIVISTLLFLSAAIFAASMVRFTFIAIMGGLCLAGILSAARQRRYMAIIAAAVLAGMLAGIVARIEASKVLIGCAIQEIHAEPAERTMARSPPPAGMIAELKTFHKFQADEGFDYVVAVPGLESSADLIGHPRRSPFAIYEDDRPLGPAHSLVADIHELGQGRFLHWSGIGFIVSSSDGTNPATNGRNYWVVLPQTGELLTGPTKGTEAASIKNSDQAAATAEIIPMDCKFTNEFNSIAIRKTLLRDAVRLIPSAGPFGFGLAGFKALSCIRETEVHNSILQATVEFGWFGGLSLLLLIGTAGYRLFSIARVDSDARFVLCTLALVTITSMGHGSISGDLLLFALIGLAAGTYETASKS